MRRAVLTSPGHPDLADLSARFDGALATTFVGRKSQVFVEYVTPIRQSAALPIGRRLLEDDFWFDSKVLAAGGDAEAETLVSLVINSNRTVTAAFLYVSTTNSIPGTAAVDISSGISGSAINWTYSVGEANALRYYWVELVDATASSSITPLGPYTTAPPAPTSRALTFRIREINTTNLLDFTQFRLDGVVMDPASVEFAPWLNDPNGAGFSTSRLFDGSNSTRYYEFLDGDSVGLDTFTITVPLAAQTFSITPFRTNRVPGWDIVENGVVISSTDRGSNGSGAQYVTRDYDISL